MSLLIIALFALFYVLVVGRSLQVIPPGEDEHGSDEHYSSKQSLSLIVPFRNEEGSLAHLLAQIENLLPQSQLKEVILVDDHSTDGGTELVEDFVLMHPEKVKYLLSEGKASKKKALDTGIKSASSEWVLVSDADSEFPRGWLHTMLSKQEIDLLVGPVLFSSKKKSFIGSFQILDSLALLAIGQSSVEMGKPLFASASNLLFRRAQYLKLDPFSSNWNIPSGDDVFLLQAFAKAGLKIETTWSRKGLVQSEAPQTLKALLKQKIRWASKNPSVPSTRYQFTAFVVLLFNFSLALGFVLFTLDVISSLIFILWLVKFGLDYLVLRRISNVYGKAWSLFDYSRSFLVYPFYVTLVAVLSFFYKPKWK